MMRGNYDNIDLEAALNIPFNDKIQMRVSGISLDHSGYRDNAPLDIDGDDQNSYSVRAQLAFQPTDFFKGIISIQHDKTDEVGPAHAPANGPYSTILTGVNPKGISSLY